MKQKYLLALMDMAERFGMTSEAKRLQVGCLIVKDSAIISMGVNGTPAGYPTNICEDENGNTQWFVRHAECSALDKLVRSTESSAGAIMVVSHAPCANCSLRIADAGISAVYYRHEYRCYSGVKYLMKRGMLVQQI